MPEYFDISLISKKTSTSKIDMDACLKYLGLFEGENQSDLFDKKQIIVSRLDNEDLAFEETCISVPEQQFSKETLHAELEKITNFVNRCFEYNQNLEYALCSYELNGYLIEQVKKVEDFDSATFLDRFPIIYRRTAPSKMPELKINTAAQELF